MRFFDQSVLYVRNLCKKAHVEIILTIIKILRLFSPFYLLVVVCRFRTYGISKVSDLSCEDMPLVLRLPVWLIGNNNDFHMTRTTNLQFAEL